MKTRRKTPTRPMWPALILALTTSAGFVVAPLGCTNSFLGLQDYQRDLLGLAVALLVTQADGAGVGAGQPVPGAEGFDVFVERFFAPDDALPAALPIVAVPVTSPTLGAPLSNVAVSTTVGYLVGLSQGYNDGNLVMMRIFLYRSGPIEEGCLVFSVDARRLRSGDQIEVLGAPRWVRVNHDAAAIDPEGSGYFIAVDLPLNAANGLGYPSDLASGDYLAFELDTLRHDGGRYLVLGVEFYEAATGTPATNATIFTSLDDVACDCPECNTQQDCDGNGFSDDLDLAAGRGFDCNENGRLDVCDIAIGESFDCDANGVPDECAVCPPLEMVFVMDTSGSMNDEAMALCMQIEVIVADLRTRGVVVTPHVLGITEDPINNPFMPNPLPGEDDGVPDEFSCLTDNVRNLLGADVPGSGGLLDDIEDWGDASAIVASRFPWNPDSTRAIVPISDEDPQDGDSCDDPGADRDAIDNAIAVAVDNDVIVSPVVAELVGGSSERIACINGLAQDLADGTGGLVFQSVKPEADLAKGISGIVIDLCSGFSDCNENGLPDGCDINEGASTDADGNGVPDECEG